MGFVAGVVRNMQGLIVGHIFYMATSKPNTNCFFTCQQHFDKRSVYYGSRSAAEGLARGKPYDNMHKIYVLALLNFIIFKQRPQYYTRFELLATDDVKLRLSDCLQFVFVEMGKFMAAYKSHKFNDLAGWINSLDNRGVWIYSITMTPYLTPEHRGLIARRDEVMEEAMGILQQMDRAKGHERIIAEAKEKAQRDQWARAEYKFDQGLAKGEQLGIAKGEQLGVAKGRQEGDRQRQLDMARRMLKAGEPIGKICAFTQLSEAELRKL